MWISLQRGPEGEQGNVLNGKTSMAEKGPWLEKAKKGEFARLQIEGGTDPLWVYKQCVIKPAPMEAEGFKLNLSSLRSLAPFQQYFGERPLSPAGRIIHGGRHVATEEPSLLLETSLHVPPGGFPEVK